MRDAKQVMTNTTASDLIQKLVKIGAEIFLYHGVVFMKPESKIPQQLRLEIQLHVKEIRAILVA